MTWREWGLWVGVFVAAGICFLALRHRRNEKPDSYNVTSAGDKPRGPSNVAWIGVTAFFLLKTGVPLAAYGLGAVFEQGILGCKSDSCALRCYRFSRDWPLKKHPDRKVVEKCRTLEKKVHESAEKGCHN